MRTSTRFLLATLLVLPLGVTVVHAQTALSLGQATTTAVGDVSTSSNYHVYVFTRGGTRYIQINDASGAVRGAFAVTAYKAVGLPVGSDASRLATPDEPLPPPAVTTGETVYTDGSTHVFVAPQPNGTMQINLLIGDCKDPSECSTHGP
ncbi:MAG TPA: hypothetical protein VM621_05570 [Luteibacter sp.]|uniref:hypothetical protein n=1 Tax=Luteibacter sp. TaxID=1886636 RepID=UPI002C74E088|nr:hypothetical protein [Luteibacter sp.]HVI54506.1 hypothetical protein [Luteibacter sp.]